MTDLTEALQAVGLIVSVFAAYWVWQDAKNLKKRGANLSPGLWSALVFLFWLLSLPVYLILRRTTWRRQVSPPTEQIPSTFD